MAPHETLCHFGKMLFPCEAMELMTKMPESADVIDIQLQLIPGSAGRSA